MRVYVCVCVCVCVCVHLNQIWHNSAVTIKLLFLYTTCVNVHNIANSLGPLEL